nr:phosphotransferase [Tumebacillus amylolyticus]
MKFRELETERFCLRALHLRGWELVESNPIRGGYAAELYRLTVRDETGQLREVIYKKFSPERNSELELYRTVLPEVPHAIPTLYGVVDEDGEQGLILEAAGVPVKAVFSEQDAQGKREMLRGLLELLANLHTSLQEKSQHWLAKGQVSSYPFESSAQWAEITVQELAGLTEHGKFGVDTELVREVRGMAAAFYPRYPEWAVGATTYTHGDPHLENILIQNGHTRLIDWEWACVSLPQRDLSILLQDVLEDELHEFALEVYQELVPISNPSQFRTAFQACLFDNTLMMLGWEIRKYLDGHLTDAELARILPTKLRWLRTAYQSLFT